MRRHLWLSEPGMSMKPIPCRAAERRVRMRVVLRALARGWRWEESRDTKPRDFLVSPGGARLLFAGYERGRAVFRGWQTFLQFNQDKP